MELEMLINKYYNNLNENDRLTLRYIINHKRECARMSITDLATYCNLSRSSILRMTKKLGFSGFSEFKYSLKSDITFNKLEKENYYQQLNMAIETTLKRFRATDRLQIYHRIQMAEHIYAYGTGWAQRNAVLELKRNFLSCDRRIIDLTAKKEFEIARQYFTERDLLIIISLSGEIKEIIEDIRMLKFKHVPVLSITDSDFKNNELATLVPYNFYFQSINFSQRKNGNSIVNPTSLGTLFVLIDTLFFDYLFRNDGK
ncbi:MurR/RpiR family transcriptional regulator [Sporolactobacillus terrae]|uniref:HTH-type transcriptional regulator GlvR n=1 Tax=Sporolactobacillus terrae TaxID=269673 RepID=A0A5K7WWA8_9BACL|nr:MurR/RpiR family transcriptional regulator [Sporolactobacillus terrae]BBN98855.1 HTH-type transcriptional regulator GlvR [Sporolactobacillus terrae]